MRCEQVFQIFKHTFLVVTHCTHVSTHFLNDERSRRNKATQAISSKTCAQTSEPSAAKAAQRRSLVPAERAPESRRPRAPPPAAGEPG